MKLKKRLKNITAFKRELNNMSRPETVSTNSKAKIVSSFNKSNSSHKVPLKIIKDAKIYKQVGGVLIDQSRK